MMQQKEVDNFNGEVGANDENGTENKGDANESNPFDQIQSGETSTNGSTKKTYKGFGMLGTMEIPATNFKYPVLEKVTKNLLKQQLHFNGELV